MSRRDVETVATLAAHLAQRQRTVDTGIGEYQEYIKGGDECAADALALQKLGARARRCGTRWQAGTYSDDEWEAEMRRLDVLVNEVLTPYSLDGRARDSGLRIANLGGEGFDI